VRHQLSPAALLLACGATFAAAPPADPRLVVRPDAFKTLVNPNCSHCRDEAKRRAGELRPDDRVLCWVRGYSDGGAIPFRFFLEPYRVISDTYGVFVYDPDAGFARGFAPSLDFTFHGWRDGVMVMRHKDGTLYSCLSGTAFAGPRKGQRLEPVPTLVSDWGFWLKRYPGAVAYRMFDRYQPVERAVAPHEGSVKSRRPSTDPRLPPSTPVLGVRRGTQARAYPLDEVAKAGLLQEEWAGRPCVVLWYGPTRTAAAYEPLASPLKKGEAPAQPVTLRVDRGDEAAPFVDRETGSRWDVAGRAVAGKLKGWTLAWLDSTEVKWFAWSAEHPTTSIYSPGAACPEHEVAGKAEFLRSVPKRHATLQAVDAAARRVTLLAEGEREPRAWPLVADAEVKVAGWWARLGQLRAGSRVWAWFKTNRAGHPVAVCMLTDELSEQDMHGPGLRVESVGDGRITLRPVRGALRTLRLERTEVFRGREKVEPAGLKRGERVYAQSAGNRAELILDAPALEARRAAQKEALRKLWESEGLPGSLTMLHVFSGELEITLDHEAMRWGRSLKAGDRVSVQADPPIAAVVKHVEPWRERTRLRLVVGGKDQADLELGQRVRLRMPTPPRETDESDLPPDLDQKRTKEQRIEWFLASIYCTCKVGGDGCTGHCYCLASCNPNSCGMPRRMRKVLAGLIDEGWSDREIFARLLKEHGPTLMRPHLRP
jgi:hypothetical protein